MRIRIAGKEQDLKEEHRRYPDRRAPAEPRQDEFTHDGLYLKEEKGPKKNKRLICSGRAPWVCGNVFHVTLIVYRVFAIRDIFA